MTLSTTTLGVCIPMPLRLGPIFGAVVYFTRLHSSLQSFPDSLFAAKAKGYMDIVFEGFKLQNIMVMVLTTMVSR